MNTDKILLFGLGKLGLPLCLVFSQKLKVIGVDVDIDKVNDLKMLKLPFFEKNLHEYLQSGKKNILFNNSNEYELGDVDVAIILVNTPSNENGEFSNQYIYDVLDSLCDKLKISDKKDFLIIISSTVMPKTNEDIIRYVENRSGRKVNQNVGITYVPDLVALGSVIEDFENPDVLIIGESDNKYGEITHKIYSKILKNNPPVVRMSLIESEIAKVSLNTYITMKISFANFLGNICKKLNADSKIITRALGSDKRISPFYLKSGPAFGGTCFPRDTHAFIKLSEELGLDAVHIKATQKINDEQNLILYEEVKKYKNKKIGIYGISFKENTSVITESPGKILFDRLQKENYDVVFYDDLVESEYSNNLNKFIEDCDVLVITHNKKTEVDLLSKKIVINLWE